jgi:hypothetical protein
MRLNIRQKYRKIYNPNSVGKYRTSGDGKPPTEVEYYDETFLGEGYKISTEIWKENGKVHRDGDLPAVIEYYRDGSLKALRYFNHNNKHRIGGPQLIKFYEDGGVQIEAYYENNKRYRADGPAYIAYFPNGNFEEISWYDAEGRLHNLDEPALVEFNSRGDVIRSEWWWNGQKEDED